MGVALRWNQQDIKVFTAPFTMLFISAVGLRRSFSLTLVTSLLAVGLSCRHVLLIIGSTY